MSTFAEHVELIGSTKISRSLSKSRREYFFTKRLNYAQFPLFSRAVAEKLALRKEMLLRSGFLQGIAPIEIKRA